ncbi:4'-phosphopantetheinyl transferase family protein [Corynebacterium argentoratense]|uniref:4'-phosphopantetheinyl transferase family protein n=1 Tax=Corynebacterium argentoratense TaxID=42817 RepID=UPI003C6F743E
MLDPSLFPGSARYCYLTSTPGDMSNFDALHPAEKALVAHAAPRRKAEFGDGRWCAHQALAELGRDSGEPILRGDKGMPLWPASVSGSLTHTEGFRAAVVAPRLLVRSMGLDAEIATALPEGVLGSISRDSELTQLSRLRAAGVSCPDTILFCAKEATYKAWFPLTHRWLGFEQAEVDIREDGTFISYLLVRPTPVPFISGQWVIRDGLVLASTAVV